MTNPAAASLVARVFLELADGQFHSGEELARALSVSRSAIWKAANALRDLGVDVRAVRNRGYQLVTPTEPLDAARLRTLIAADVLQRLSALDIAWTVDSTNSVLLGRPNPASGTCEVCLAEYQTAGRGRRGRSWLAPPGGAICLSLSWTFPAVPRDLSALSLVTGVCVLRALDRLGLAGTQLKWPNDVLVGTRKLGGILIELRAESSGPACVVIGIGLNVTLGGVLLERVAATGVEATDLVSAGISERSRNVIAARLIESCVEGLLAFEREGLRPFIEEWRVADALRGRTVAVQAGNDRVQGLARGIDLTGALLVETPQGLKKFISGEVTVRSVP